MMPDSILAANRKAKNVRENIVALRGPDFGDLEISTVSRVLVFKSSNAIV